MKPSVVLIGAGNVGEHLGKRLRESAYPVLQVFSRSMVKAEQLAKAIQSEPVNNLEKIRTDAEVYLLAVSDNAIKSISDHLKQLNDSSIIAHTSGATALPAINHRFVNAGVFYPLQTFSRGVELDYKAIPIIIQSRSQSGLAILSEMGTDLFGRTVEMNDTERATLHLAAVFVNNFANHMLAIGEKLMDSEGLDPQILSSLIKETFRKAEKNKAKEMQTGPALRNDKVTINKHLLALEKYPELAELYQIMTNSIKDFHLERTKDQG